MAPAAKDSFWSAAPAEPAPAVKSTARLEPEGEPDDHYDERERGMHDERDDRYDDEPTTRSLGADASARNEGRKEQEGAQATSGSEAGSTHRDRPTERLIGDDDDERASQASRNSKSSAGIGKARDLKSLAAALRSSRRDSQLTDGTRQTLEVDLPGAGGEEDEEEEEEEDESPQCLSLEPLRYSYWRYFFYILALVFSFGLFWLIARTHPRLHAFCTKRRANPLERPQFVLLQGLDLKWYELRIHKHSIRNSKAMRELCGQAAEAELLPGEEVEETAPEAVDADDAPAEADDAAEAAAAGAAGPEGGRRLTPAEKRRLEQRRVFYIDFQAKRYTSFDKFKFSRMQFKFNHPIADVVESFADGLSTPAAKLRLKLCGYNDIREGIAPISAIILEKALRPYYLFQVFCIALWIFEGYSVYAYIVLAISLLCYFYEIRVASNRRTKLVRRLGDDLKPVHVLRDGREVLLSAEYLVPGDVLLLQADAPVPCDVVILEGECLVDESMFAGQPLPLSKQALPAREVPNATYTAAKFATSTIMGGSRILQVYGETALRVLVAKTGYSTVKGAFFHSGVLFRKKSLRNALVDLQYYLVVMALLGVGGTVAALVQILYRRARGKESGKFNLRETFITCADFMTIALPPAIQLAFSLCNAFGAFHLKGQGVKCLDTDCMPVAGKVNTICLDKTGVMTSDKIQFQGVHPTSGSRFREVTTSLLGSQSLGVIEQCLAICHALNAGASDLTARPIDIEPFRATGWKLIEPDRKREEARHVIVVCKPPPRIPTGAAASHGADQNEEWAVLRRFAFDARTRCSSVIALGVDSSMLQAFVKGAPESIQRQCRPHTVPANFAQVLRSHEEQGFVVLACGVRVLPSCNPTEVNMIRRSAVESSLDFAGFLLLRNAVRPETNRFIELTKEARLRIAMITGDSLLTAVAVAKKSGMVSRDPRVFVADVQPRAGAKAIMPLSPGGLASGTGLGSGAGLQRRGSVAAVAMMARSPRADDADEFEVVFYDANNDTRQFTYAEVIENVDKDPSSACLVVTGACVRHLADGDEVDIDMLVELSKRANLYTRVSPDDKVTVIEVLQDRLGLWSAMVGDGLNDCGALRAAPAGLAIGAQLAGHSSEARAVAPLETKTGDISAMMQVLRQGQCTLVTATSIFRFIAIYSAMQLAYTLRLFYIGSGFGTAMMLYQDLALMLPLAALMCFNRAKTSGIAQSRPHVSIVHLVMSVLLEMLAFLAILIFTEWFLKSRPWYCGLACPEADGLMPACPNGDLTFLKNNCGSDQSRLVGGRSYDQSVTWSMSSIQVLAACLSVNFHGDDNVFRRPIIHNVFFVLYWSLLFVLSTWIHVAPPSEATTLFDLTRAPTDFLIVTYVVALSTLPLTIILEKFVSPRLSANVVNWFNGVRERYRAKRIARDQRRREERLRKEAMAEARAQNLVPARKGGRFRGRKERKAEREEHIAAMRAAAQAQRAERRARLEELRMQQQAGEAEQGGSYDPEQPEDPRRLVHVNL